MSSRYSSGSSFPSFRPLKERIFVPPILAGFLDGLRMRLIESGGGVVRLGEVGTEVCKEER